MSCPQYLLIVLYRQLTGLNKLFWAVFNDQFIELLGVATDPLAGFRDWPIGNSWLDPRLRLLAVFIASEGVLRRLDVSSRLPFLNAC